MINSGLRFLLEIASVVLLIVSGFSKNKFPLNIFIGVILPVLFVGLWSVFVAPASPYRSSLMVRLCIEMVIYFSTATVLWYNYSFKAGVFYLVFSLLNSTLNQVGDKLYG